MTKPHGWLVLNKPRGMTSTRAVSLVKRLFRGVKVGHGGTLDPLAEGVLPIALGEATKTLSYVMDGIKTYAFSAVWGEQRSTDDAEGEVVATSTKIPTLEEILSAVSPFQGQILQTPPDYSALWVDGKRAYDLAREGQEVTLAPRPVMVHAFEVTQTEAHQAHFVATVGKGTYIRALVRDLAKALHTCAYAGYIRRTRVGRFDLSHALDAENLASMTQDSVLSHIQPIEHVLDDIPAVVLEMPEAARLRNGQSVRPAITAALSNATSDKGVLCLDCKGVPVALATFAEGLLHPRRGFNF
ncbi:MAG: tRNA pseudouridine(55) synthase TruB [Holosporales bacterium]